MAEDLMTDLQQDIAAIDAATIPPPTDDTAATTTDTPETDVTPAEEAPPSWAQAILASTTNLGTQLKALESRIERAEARGVVVDPDLKASVDRLLSQADEQRMAGMTGEEREAELRRQLEQERAAKTTASATEGTEDLQAQVEESLEESYSGDLLPDFQRYARAQGLELTAEHAAVIREAFDQFEFKADRATGRVTNLAAFRQEIKDRIDTTAKDAKAEVERSPVRNRGGATGPSARPAGAAPGRAKVDFVNGSLRDLLGEAPELKQFDI